MYLITILLVALPKRKTYVGQGSWTPGCPRRVIYRNEDNSVDIVPVLRARQPMNRGSTPGGGKKFVSYPDYPDRFWQRPVTYLMNTGTSFSWGKSVGT
jgi:hypothetical protein